MFFCTDLHGSDVCFKKFVNAADFYGTQILIMGGDVTGKMVVPIARQPSGVYLTSFAGEDLEFTSDDGGGGVQEAARQHGLLSGRHGRGRVP